MPALFGIFGLMVLIGIAVAFSRNRSAIDWRLVLTGIALQIGFAVFVILGPKMVAALEQLHSALPVMIKTFAKLLVGVSVLFALAKHLGRNGFSPEQQGAMGRIAGYAFGIAAFISLPFMGEIFDVLAKGFVKLLEFVAAGSGFVFADLVNIPKSGFIFAFQVLPTIIFFAALMGVLYHIGLMQLIVRWMAIAITKVMRVSGAETTSVCASVFIGQTEAPLTVRPYISKMTESELLTMMIGGMAHIAGGVMGAYIQMLGGADPAAQAMFAKHFLAASIMAAPATLLLAKILVPETGEPLTRGEVRMHVEKNASNVIEAAAGGAADGLKLALNIAAMLLAFISLIALFNAGLGWLGDLVGFTQWMNSTPRAVPFVLNIQTILGYVLSPIAWVIGVPWSDATTVGSLIGQKITLNEFIAYQELSKVVVGTGPGQISREAQLIATYALCGFANFSSIAIQIGGIGGLAPERRSDLARMGLIAVLGGCLATFMTATIAGALIKMSGGI
jgi:concentrative nucleoside transporter, CNT family